MTVISDTSSFPQHLALLNREMKHTYALTSEDRKTLIDWYIDCLEDMGEEVDDVSEYLCQLGNASFVQECVDFMPQCLEDLKRSKLWISQKRVNYEYHKNE